MKTLLLLLLSVAAYAQNPVQLDSLFMAKSSRGEATPLPYHFIYNDPVYYPPSYKSRVHQCDALPDLRKEKMPRVGDVYRLPDGSAYEFCKDMLIGRQLQVTDTIYYWKSVNPRDYADR